ncbi:uncharacterized protein A4U43_C06F3390 [Asparagus officinalis]|uniref:Pectinesterase catalytic domain-containing protein n=1 Tax=Asparagus officinalis TaxID=4686 RepID=A0A5P1EJS1_ASPOF|nr:uncharacterized protein A4U43_C06F3390 [Asparagus officinalis]
MESDLGALIRPEGWLEWDGQSAPGTLYYAEYMNQGGRREHNESSLLIDQSPQKKARHRDIGTEMTPLASSTTTRCHSPIKSSSPARHSTPASKSGPLMANGNRVDISELDDCHFAKIDLGAQFDLVALKWSSREEKEYEISKSLKHLGIDGGRKSIEENSSFFVER